MQSINRLYLVTINSI